MAVSNVTVSQTNIVEGASILSCHNPLIFLITATYTGTPPAWCRAYVMGFDSVLYNCLYLRDESATERTFYLVADEILRGHIGALANFDQSEDTLLQCKYLDALLTLYFEVEGAIAPVTVTATMVNASKDFESITGACMVDEYTNVTKTYVAQKNEMVYLYWFNDNAENEIKIIDPTKLVIYSTNQTTVSNMGAKLQELYYPNLVYNTASTAGQLSCQRLTSGGGVNIGFYFVTGTIAGTVGSFSNIVSDFTYTLDEISPGQWKLTFDITTNPTNGQSFSFDCTLVGYPKFTITGEFSDFSPVTFPIGFIRYALKPTESTTFSGLMINDDVYPHNIIVRNECPGYVLLRYADRNGQYRIMPFSKYYSRAVNPELIGEINQLVLSLKNDSGDTRPVGYRNRDTLKLTAQNLTEPEYTLLKDLFNSPDVEAYINGKWLRVRVQGDNVVKLEKRKLKDVTITVELPTSYNITEL